MNRIGFVLKVKPELMDEYTRRHQEVWPEMLEALNRTGWHNYSLFLRGDGTLFGYFETPGKFEDAVEAMSREEINHAWQAEMAHFFEGSGEAADTIMEQLTEVFHLV